VCVACSAEKTASIDYVSLCCDAISFLHVGDESPDFDDIAGELVSYDEWRLASRRCPRIPVVDVYIRAAHTGTTNANENLIISNARLWYITQDESRSRIFFHKCFHFLMLDG
jgi:hypothetical protein